MVKNNYSASQDGQLLKMLPINTYEFVNVTFAAADTDTVIATTLVTDSPNDIRWIDVTPGTGRVYRAADPNKTPWKNTYIILRSSAIGSTRLLLFVERN